MSRKSAIRTRLKEIGTDISSVPKWLRTTVLLVTLSASTTAAFIYYLYIPHLQDRITREEEAKCEEISQELTTAVNSLRKCEAKLKASLEAFETHIEVSQECTGEGQKCGNPVALELSTASIVDITYHVGDQNCAPLLLYVYVDGVLFYKSVSLGWYGAEGALAGLPLSMTVRDIGNGTQGVRFIVLEAEATNEGCTLKNPLRSWGGRLDLRFRKFEGSG